MLRELDYPRVKFLRGLGDFLRVFRLRVLLPATLTERSSAMNDAGVASKMRLPAAQTIKSWSPSNAALNSDSAGTNSTT